MGSGEIAYGWQGKQVFPGRLIKAEVLQAVEQELQVMHGFDLVGSRGGDKGIENMLYEFMAGTFGLMPGQSYSLKDFLTWLGILDRS